MDGSCTEQNYSYSCGDLNDPIVTDEVMAQKPFDLYGLCKMAAVGMRAMRGQVAAPSHSCPHGVTARQLMDISC